MVCLQVFLLVALGSIQRMRSSFVIGGFFFASVFMTMFYLLLATQHAAFANMEGIDSDAFKTTAVISSIMFAYNVSYGWRRLRV